MNLESGGPQRGKKQDFLSQVAIDTDPSPRIKRKKSLSVFSQRAVTEKAGCYLEWKAFISRDGDTGVAVSAREGLELGPCGHCGFEWMTLLN